MTLPPPYLNDPYARSGPAEVLGTAEGGAVWLGPSILYAMGGGQPGDRGRLVWADGAAAVLDTRKPGEGAPAGAAALAFVDAPVPPGGVTVHLDWDLRLLHMRIHTALHLLSVVIPAPVTGGQIGPGRGRLDFDLPDAPDPGAIETALNALIARDLPVTQDWITDDELAANPGLVKTMSVKPPMGQGRVRLVRIGAGDSQIDLQPCGGTHVARTGEIGAVVVEKIEKKGRQNRRVAVRLLDAT
jgi:misacylated tRNA(Ala) deacylase